MLKSATKQIHSRRGGIWWPSAIRDLLVCTWASAGTILLSGHRLQRGWRSWADEHGRGHLWPARRACQPCPQTRSSVDPGSWKSSVMDTMESKVNRQHQRTRPFTHLAFWHTAHFSTFPALLAHFTKARRRTNSCLVRLANWTISIFLKPIQRFNISSTMLASNESMTWWNVEPYLSMSVFLGRLMNEQTKKKKKSVKYIKTTMQVKFWSVSSSLTWPHMTLASMCQQF